ncbi:MAG: enoyl-CoA hydratase/isomerase family protein [Thermoanaerobaculia bacterium]
MAEPTTAGSTAEPTAEPTAAQSTLVHLEVKDGVAYLTLDDPPANTYTHEMMRQLDEAILKARFDKDVYVIVLRGEGDKFFCAGANINMLKSSDPYFKYYFCLHANETLNRLEQTPKLVVAALDGHTVGGGLEIAMAADILIARKGSGKMGLPEINLGVLPGTGGTQRLARRVGKTISIDLMITGRLIDFEEGQKLGIINYIFEGDNASFAEQIHNYAKEFTPPNKAAKAAGRIKRSVQSGWEVPFESGLAIERELQQQLFESPDAKEGLDAYVSKRKPEFRGW